MPANFSAPKTSSKKTSDNILFALTVFFIAPAALSVFMYIGLQVTLAFFTALIAIGWVGTNASIVMNLIQTVGILSGIFLASKLIGTVIFTPLLKACDKYYQSWLKKITDYPLSGIALTSYLLIALGCTAIVACGLSSLIPALALAYANGGLLLLIGTSVGYVTGSIVGLGILSAFVAGVETVCVGLPALVWHFASRLFKSKPTQLTSSSNAALYKADANLKPITANQTQHHDDAITTIPASSSDAKPATERIVAPYPHILSCVRATSM